MQNINNFFLFWTLGFVSEYEIVYICLVIVVEFYSLNFIFNLSGLLFYYLIKKKTFCENLKWFAYNQINILVQSYW